MLKELRTSACKDSMRDEKHRLWCSPLSRHYLPSYEPERSAADQESASRKSIIDPSSTSQNAYVRSGSVQSELSRQILAALSQRSGGGTERVRVIAVSENPGIGHRAG